MQLDLKEDLHNCLAGGLDGNHLEQHKERAHPKVHQEPACRLNRCSVTSVASRAYRLWEQRLAFLELDEVLQPLIAWPPSLSSSGQTWQAAAVSAAEVLLLPAMRATLRRPARR